MNNFLHSIFFFAGLQTSEQLGANCQNHWTDSDRVDLHFRRIPLGIGLFAGARIMRPNANVGQHPGEGIDVGDAATGKPNSVDDQNCCIQ